MPLPERFADLHCHPSFKAVLSNGRGKSKGLTAWDRLVPPLTINKPENRFLYSQSSLRQLHKGRVNLAVAPLYGLERAFTRSELLEIILRISGPFDGPFFRSIRRSEHSYFDLFLMDLEAMHAFPQDPDDHGRKLRVLNSMAQYDVNSPDVCVVLAAEGAHNFYGQANGKDDVAIDTLKQNLARFKRPDGPRLLYITLTHLERNELGNHCYGIKMIRDSAFFPTGHGMTPLGQAFVREALDTSGGRRRILPDVKHMSLQTRIDLYRMRKEFYDNDPFPLLCTHAGVTGISYTEVFKYVDGWYKPIFQDHINVRYIKPVGIDGGAFNPWSINLYNEDIAEIMASGGLIGVSLDQRILGFGDIAIERMSPREAFKPTNFQLTFRDEREGPDPDPSVEETFRQFCANLLHIIRIGATVPGVADPWDHVCIGSDFDGLIDPVNACPTIEHMPDFMKQLAEVLPRMAAKGGMPMSSAEVDRCLNKLFHDNLVDFLRKHFV
jgi:microsomal dipeptidase-like Zn-dependent dipeptidase